MNKENTENKNNTGKKDIYSTIFGLLVFINVAVELSCIIYLNKFYSLLDFMVKDRSNVDELHKDIFIIFARKQEVYISNATIWIFVAGLIAVIASFVFKRKKEAKLSHLFLMLSTGLNLVAGVYHLLSNLLWTNCSFTGLLGDLILYCVSLSIGVGSLVWGLFFHKIKESPRMDEQVPFILASVLLVATCVCIAYPFIALNAERNEVNTLRQTIANQQTGYDEEIGYQIGNYANANALYLDGKLYLTKYNPEFDAEEILAIDRNGNMEVFQIAPEEVKDFSSCLYHYNGYIYALARDTDSYNCQVLRISVADKSAETLLEGERYAYFGIHNNLLLIKGFDAETQTHCIDAYDLSKPVTEENRYIYDYGTQTSVLDWEFFVNYYVYGNTLYHDYGSYQSAGMCVGDNFYGAYNPAGIDGVVYLQTPDTVFENRTAIDDRALQINIFDQALYYIKLADDYETYEVYTCDLSGEEKTLIGTMPRELFTDCYNLSVAEDFMIIYGKDRETEVNSTYLMWLDDGSYEKLW